MDLNPQFTGYKKFRPSRLGGELQLFQRTGIDLVHGWLVDPSSPEHRAVVKTQDYDSSMDLVVEADDLTHGKFVVSQDASGASGSGSPGIGNTLTHDQREKVEDGECPLLAHVRSY